MVAEAECLRRADLTYLTFLHNALFVPFNYAGDLLLCHPKVGTKVKAGLFWRNVFKDVLDFPAEYFRKRYAEPILQVLTGESQEGHFAIL